MMSLWRGGGGKVVGGGGGGGWGSLTSSAAWLPVQAAWARGESQIPRKEAHVDSDSAQENFVPLLGLGCPLFGLP